MTTTSTPIDVLLKHAQTLYGKYKFMESQLIAQQKSLLTKIPDIESALQALKHLIAKQQSDDDEDKICECRFELADNLFAKAKVDTKQNHVLLWLGVSRQRIEKANTLDLNSHLPSLSQFEQAKGRTAKADSHSHQSA